MQVLREDSKILGHTLAQTLVGLTLGHRWLIQELIGIGGMGVVFKATDGPEGAAVVAKVLAPQLASDQWIAFVKASRREARALRRLSERIPPSPYIVRFFDEGEVEIPLPYSLQRKGYLSSIPIRYVILEYVDGRPYGTTLHERIHASLNETKYGFSPIRARRLLRHIARALYDIHGERIVHRDLKPSNVLVSGPPHEEVARVTDFGIVCLQDESQYTIEAISAGYSAPEQYLSAEKSPVGVYTDLFSFGVLAYEVLTGCALFPQEPELALAAAYRSHRFSLRDASTLHPDYINAEQQIKEIDSILIWATQSSIYERPKDIRTLWHALDSVLSSIQPQSSTSYRWSAYDASTARLKDEKLYSKIEWRKQVNHPKLPEFSIERVVCDEKGNAVAIGPYGLLYWNGLNWNPSAAPDRIPTDKITCLAYLGEHRYALGGHHGMLVFFTESDWTPVPHIDSQISISALKSHSTGLLAVAGNRSNQAPIIWCAYYEDWFAPLTLNGFKSVHELLFLNGNTLLVVGESTASMGLIGMLRVEDRLLDPVQVVTTAEPIYAIVSANNENKVWVTGQSGVMIPVFIEQNHNFKIGKTVQRRISMIRGVQNISGLVDIAVSFDSRLWTLWNDGVWVSENQDWNCVWPSQFDDFPGVQLQAVGERMLVFLHNGDVLEANIHFTND